LLKRVRMSLASELAALVFPPACTACAAVLEVEATFCALCTLATEPVPLPVRKGGMILMHKETPHRSTPNRSDTVRWSMDLRYQNTGTPTGRPFHPAFVVRSRSDPASVLTDHAAWCRMWEADLASAAAAGVSAHRWARTG